MQADKTTLTDLSIFNADEEQSILKLLNFTKTVGGKDWLRHFLSTPHNSIEAISHTQQVIRKIGSVQDQWERNIITNGTIMVIERFYETPLDEIPSAPGLVGSISYRLFSSADYSLVRYSVKHFVDFLLGMQQVVDLLQDENNPLQLKILLDRTVLRLNKAGLQPLLKDAAAKDISNKKMLALGYFFKRRFKEEVFELIEVYSKLDAYYSMAVACRRYNFVFPAFTEGDTPAVTAKQLYHPLLYTPVAYDVSLSRDNNFLFLTGANMAGKSTFIKAVGVSVYLAHTGMGVPAKEMQLTLFDGLLSNINVVDNIIQGESYFYNEVQRIKKTIEKINDGKKWLILIDELFKGTNVQDAMKCSSTVIEGLRKMNNSLFILSTHLYEIGDALKVYPNIQFKYFETSVENDQLQFSYQLKDGISNDRLGYLILKREGVVEMLEKL